MKEVSLLSSTGYEFARDYDLVRDEDNARMYRNRKHLLRIRIERQRRRWTDEQRHQFAGLSERWYEIK